MSADREEQLHHALSECVGALVRMIPDACDRFGVEPIDTAEHDQVIAKAATALHGEDRSKWPPVLKAAAEGEFE
jgi:hypothetical protein